jgi:hypothetical protein
MEGTMVGKMEIELALANLEAGKFSFRMVDAIKDRVDTLDKEVTLLRGLHADAMHELRQQQLATWRLEAEATRLNEKIHALLKANAVTEKASHLVAQAGSRTGETLHLLQERATPTATRLLEKAIDGMASLAIKLVKFAHKPPKRMAKIEERLEILKKQASASLERTSSHVSASGKNAA